MHRALLLLAALTALGFGGFGLFAPAATAEAVRLGAEDPFAVGEVRVVYGGLWLGMAFVLFAALCSPRWLARAEGVWWAWLGLPLARAVAWGVDGGDRTFAFLLGELAMVAVLGAALLLARRRGAATESSANRASDDLSVFENEAGSFQFSQTIGSSANGDPGRCRRQIPGGCTS